MFAMTTTTTTTARATTAHANTAVRRMRTHATPTMGRASFASTLTMKTTKRRSTHVVVRAEGESGEVASASSFSPGGSFAKVCELEELPRGERKLVRALGKSILMFWYRDRVYAIESRSPAEGAYSEGFERARLTQDGCIECPTTKSTFDLKTGEIKEWYPDNAWLRMLTPQDTCRNMEVFPVEMKQDGIYVDAKNGSLGPDFVAPVGFGGSNTSLENNNVFGVEPMMYVEGEEKGVSTSSSTSTKIDPGQLGGAIALAATVAVAGSAACLYYENYIALGALWIVGFAGAAAVALKATGALEDE